MLDEESPIRVWREYRGLTGAKLAKQAGVAQSYISNIEKGKRAGSIKVLQAISKALGVDVDRLLQQETS